MDNLKILHLEDIQSDADLVRRELKKGNMTFELLWVTNKQDYVNALRTFHPDVILSDHSLPDFNSFQALKLAQEEAKDTPFILVTATISEEFAVSMIKNGAEDYILKDRLQRLPSAVTGALEKHQAERENKIQQEEIIRNEKKFRGLIEKSNDLICLLDDQFQVFYQSPNYQRITGWSPDDIKGTSPMSRVHPDDLNSVMQVIQQVVMREGKAVALSYRLRHKLGHYLWMDGTATNMLHDPSIQGIILNLRDVTEVKAAEIELRLTHERVLFHLENSPLGFIEWDNTMTMKSWSGRAQEIFGWADGEFKARHKTALSEIYIHDRERVSHILSQLLSGNLERSYLQCRNYTREGNIIWCEWFISLLKNESGAVVTMMSLVQDFTERKMGETSLLKSQANLTAIIENADAYIYSLDRDLRYIMFNTPLKNIMKSTYHVDIKAGMLVHDFLGADSAIEAKEWETIYNRVLDGHTQHFIKDYSMDAHPSFINFSIHPILDNGNVIGVSSFARDITLQHLAEEKIVQSELRFRAMIENNYDAIILRDKNFKTIYHTPSAMRMLGFSEDTEAYKLDSRSSYHPDELARIEETKIELLKNPGKAIVFNVRKKHRLGHYISVEGVMINMLDNPSVRGIVSNFRDVTERKRSEEEKSNLVAQLIEQNNDLTQFSFIASHNLRSPVASLLGLVGLFDPEEVKGESASLIPHIKQSVQNLNAIIKDIAEVVNIRTGEQHQKDTVNILTIITEIRSLLTAQIESLHVEFILDNIEVTLFHTIKTYFHSILYNLISNAIKFHGQYTPAITIRTFRKDSSVIITIRDNGLGIDLERFGEKIFGLYHRFHLEVEGKGLGLYMVKTQVQALNGTIQLESQPGHGALFTIQFPE